MQYEILYYNALDNKNIEKKFQKTLEQLRNGDFKSAEVKKLKPTPYYRAKLDNTHRLLFQPVSIENKPCLLLLEVIKNHGYEKSRFLHGKTILDEVIAEYEWSQAESTALTGSIHQDRATKIHFLDKCILFDSIQDEVLQHNLPLIIIGSAGSGKTSVTLEKLKQIPGDLLYVSLSNFLVKNSRQLYYAANYENEAQQIDFLSFRELLETIKIPRGHEIDAQTFIAWANKQARPKYLYDTRKLFEEFRGVMTGSEPNQAYLSKADYLALGIKQSIYHSEERESVYALFEKYLNFLKSDDYFDSNILSYEYQPSIQARYEAIVVDEVQDFTNSQLDFVLRHLINRDQFILSGDANQIVHPNFFSWSKLKSYFYESDHYKTETIIRILANNYRNTPEVTELANRILKFKNARFGSIDKESHYLVHSTAKHHGIAQCVSSTVENLQNFDNKIVQSARSAIVVLTEQHKLEAKKYFRTPLIFTVQEAKGLEYENVILYQFISDESSYREICKGVGRDFIHQDHVYARVKDKTNKDLEIYKFYVNALYVAITRAIKNVYLLENDVKAPLLQLLDINEIKTVNLDIAASNKEEWQQEATRLAQQGKKEQADAIENLILRHKPVPWETLTQEKLDTCLEQLNQTPTKTSKQDNIRLLNYAILYHRNDILHRLIELNFKAARNLKHALKCMDEQFFSAYRFNNDKKLRQEIDHYGLNFRDPFNFTPLMCAVYIGNAKHVKTLLELGCSYELVDNHGRDCLTIALEQAYKDEQYVKK